MIHSESTYTILDAVEDLSAELSDCTVHQMCRDVMRTVLAEPTMSGNSKERERGRYEMREVEEK